uniref:Beta-1,4-N-acetylgalactosaminyltransferase n=1 Tax=Anopheles dirus TaxID=7168 RepID=A0A182NNE1_9DIPT
ATEWPKRTHVKLENDVSTAAVGNGGKVHANAQHNNDQLINNDSTIDLLKRGELTSNASYQSADALVATQLNLLPDLSDTSVQHNNPENENVIRSHEKEPTKRTPEVSGQHDMNNERTNTNHSSLFASRRDASSANSTFSNRLANAANNTGLSSAKSDRDLIGETKSTIEAVNNVQRNSTAIPAVKLDAPMHAPPRIDDIGVKADGSESENYQKIAASSVYAPSDKFTINSCPPIPPNLDGPIDVDATFEPLSAVEDRFAAKLQPGGHYMPPDCTARNRVAIIVPYRDREQHLPVFLKNIHALLMKQQLEYGIYIVEQTAGSSFNRAALMNIGFVEAMKQKNWECMVFHDIDLLPMDDRNLYTCPDQPRHMSVAVDTFGFKLPYSTIFGGVSAMTEKQFRTVNGFSNSFWGWGGEDDDMSNRLKHVGFHIARYPVNIARYTMLNHKKEKANPKRYEKLVNGAKRFDSDGLNSLHYQLVNLIRKPLYTWIHADISP